LASAVFSAASLWAALRADRAAKTGKVQEIIQMCQKAGFDMFALRGKQSDVSTLIEL